MAYVVLARDWFNISISFRSLEVAMILSKSRRQCRAATIAALLILPLPVGANWSADPGVSVPVCVAIGEQTWIRSVGDGANGIIITWQDSRTYPSLIYIQRIGADGSPVWAADGVPICTASSSGHVPEIISDGAGGAVITWWDNRAVGRIRAQRVSAEGITMWGPQGVSVCEAPGRQESPALVGDGSGGAIIAWGDQRNGDFYDIYAQRVSSAGVVQWSANGIPVCNAARSQYRPLLATDGAAGAIIVWSDGRNDWDIYAQRVTDSGQIAWQVDGVAVCAATGQQGYPFIITDGAHGAILAWTDERNGYLQLYAQRVSGAGESQWAVDGVNFSFASEECGSPVLIPDSAGGAVVAWHEWHPTGNTISATRIDADGDFTWTTNVATLGYPYHQANNPQISSDGADGAIVTWSDTPADKYDFDILAQHISGAGASLWQDGGVRICSAPGDQGSHSMVADGEHGAIVAWHDLRNSEWTQGDVFVQRVMADGRIAGHVSAVPAVAVHNLRCLPNPFNPRATIHFDLPEPGPVRLAIHDLAGRLIRTLVDQYLSAGSHQAIWDGRDAFGRDVASGTYLARFESGGGLETLGIGLVR
jgi:hypothetical protein